MYKRQNTESVGNLPLGDGIVFPQIAEPLGEKNGSFLFQIPGFESILHESRLLSVEQDLQDGMIGLHIPIGEGPNEILDVALDIQFHRLHQQDCLLYTSRCV